MMIPTALLLLVVVFDTTTWRRIFVATTTALAIARTIPFGIYTHRDVFHAKKSGPCQPAAVPLGAMMMPWWSSERSFVPFCFVFRHVVGKRQQQPQPSR
jgi:hypothetical protein